MKNVINKIMCAVAACLLAAGTAAGQSPNRLSGVVTDENGAPFIGVSVVVKGTTTGTSTNAKGEYSLPVKKGNTVQFSFMGYEPQEVTVNVASTANVKLMPSTETLEEVIVIGYGTANKSDLAGSVASLGEKGIANYKTASVVEAMGGQMAGVQVTQMDGSPGAGFDIKIRGVGTVNSDSGPMFVVDGFQVDNIDYLANSDIVSMEILKDASAAAIYGARAANGVVMITTKSGKQGKPVVSFSGSANYREISKHLDVMSPYEFVKLQVELDPKYAEKYYRTGNDPSGVPYRYQSLDDYIGVAGVDWQDEVFRPTWSQDYNASISGGNADTKYTFSFSRYSEKGLFRNSGFDKTTAKARINQKLYKNLTLDLTLNYVNSDKKGISTSADGGRFNILSNIISARPTGGLQLTDQELLDAVVDPMIEEGGGDIAQLNPIKQAESVTNDTEKNLWQANASLTWQIVKNLTFRTAATYSMEDGRTDVFYRVGSRQEYRAKAPYGESTETQANKWTNFNYLTYKNVFCKVHSLEAMLGQEINFRSDRTLKAQAKDFPTDVLENDNLGLGTPSLAQSGYSDKTLLSYFGRVNYAYDNRYLLYATLRADGSSVFSQSHKWAWSPSFSAAWRISEEQFMKSQSVINNLKIRGSWGVLGNDRIPYNLYMNLYQASKYGMGKTTYTSFDSKQLPNDDIRWEGSTTINLGIDLGLLGNRITFTGDVFRKDTKDLLMERKLAQASGFDYQWRNIGKIRNEGIELTLSTVNLRTKSGFEWRTDFNITFQRNTLRELQEGQDAIYYATRYDSNMTDYDYVSYVGGSLGQMYGYVWDGVYQADDFNVDAVTGKYVLKDGVVNNTFITGNMGPGALKLRDLDGDGKVTTADRTVIGNGTPKFYGGLNNSFFYKNVDLGIMLQFSYGNDVYNATRMFSTQSDLERQNRLGEVAGRWTPTNPTHSVPSATGYTRNQLYSRYIEDGSFLRLKNLTIGYTFPEKWMKKVHISRLRVYATGANLFVLNNYSGYDPEVSVRASNPLTPSFDWGAYPRSRVYTFGLDLSF